MITLSKEEARRALVNYQLKSEPLDDCIERLRSFQFDPLAPIGSNHDLALQARVPGYKIGDWQQAAYTRRHAYDGWDKQACLIAFSGWPARRVLHKRHASMFKRIFDDHPDAVDAVLRELEERGPMAPKDFDFQLHKAEWKGSWFGPSVTKQTLRALWHTGKVLTHSRKGTQHIYDLAERIVPNKIYRTPELEDAECFRQILLDRHKSAGILRPTAPYELWAMDPKWYDKKATISSLAEKGDVVPVSIDGMLANVTPKLLDEMATPAAKKVRFIAPLDQLIWDRKLIAHIFGFEYLWEVYVPENKRRWGYYVLPVLYGDTFVARAEFWCRAGTIEVRGWWFETKQQHDFYIALEEAFSQLAFYAGATSIIWPKGTERSLQQASKNALKR